MAAANIDASIASKSGEIKSLPYAKYIVAEDVIERNFGFKIIRHQVSSGRNSMIYKCETVKYSECYCLIKAYRLGKEKVKLSLKEETVQIMRYVCGKCPQLVSTYEMFYTSEKIYLMCDWSSRGEVLENLKQKAIKLNEEMLRNWAVDIMNAVNFLHGNGICHRNIAPSCLLLTSDNRVKIGTLGDAAVYCKPDGSLIKQKWAKFSRTANWNQAPEVAKGKLYDPRRADIWSIGATIFWFITRLHPIEYKSGARMTTQLEHRLGMMRKVTKKCQTFVRKMLSFQPAARPTITQAMQVEWFSASPGGGPAAKEATPDIVVPEKTVETGEAAGPEESAQPERSGSRSTPTENGGQEEAPGEQ